MSSKVYLAKSGTIAGVAISGIVTFTVDSKADLAKPKSEAKLYHNKIAVTGITETITAEFDAADNAIANGASGTLSLVGQEMTEGVTAGGTLTFACTKVVVGDVSRTIGMDGAAKLRVTVEVISATGDASGITVTAA